MPQNPRPVLLLAKRRATVAEMYLQGRYQWEIGEVVGIDQGSVARDLKAIYADWKASGVRDFDAAKEQELARINALEREYWQSWQDSKAERETTSTKRTTGDSEKMEAAVKKERREGNPAFLTGVQWCIAQRIKLLGLEPAPKAPVEGEAWKAYAGFDPDAV